MERDFSTQHKHTIPLLHLPDQFLEEDDMQNTLDVNIINTTTSRQSCVSIGKLQTAHNVSANQNVRLNQHSNLKIRSFHVDKVEDRKLFKGEKSSQYLSSSKNNQEIKNLNTVAIPYNVASKNVSQTCANLKMSNLSTAGNGTNEDAFLRLRCPECNEIMLGPQNAQEHCLVCRCPECGWLERRVSQLHQHVMDQHGGAQLFCSGENHCSLCGILTNSDFLMAVHILQDHGERRVFFCDLEPCAPDRIPLYGCYADLDMHMRQVHNMQLPLATSVSPTVEKRCVSPSVQQLGRLAADAEQVLQEAVPMVEVVLEKESKIETTPCPAQTLQSNFSCPHCARSLSSADELSRHIIGLHGGRVSGDGMTLSLPCPVRNCTDRFRGKAELEAHLSLQHARSGARQQKCPYCVFVSYYASSIDMHVKTMHRDRLPDTHVAKKHGCPIVTCRSQFKSLKAVEYHLRQHHRDEPCLPGASRCYCPFCRSPFPNQRSLRMHIIKSHNERLPVGCTMCSQRFLNERWLRMHVERNHCTTVCHFCTKCRVMLPAGENSREAAAHVEAHRQDCDGHVHSYVSFICTQCNASFQEERKLKQHAMLCKGGQVMRCSECSDTFTNVSYYKQHMRTVHYDMCAFKCQPCHLGFHKFGNYTVHCERIHGRPPEALKQDNLESTYVVERLLSSHDVADDAADDMTCKSDELLGSWGGSSRTTERAKQFSGEKRRYNVVHHSEEDLEDIEVGGTEILPELPSNALSNYVNSLEASSSLEKGHPHGLYQDEIEEAEFAYYSRYAVANHDETHGFRFLADDAEPISYDVSQDLLAKEQPTVSGQANNIDQFSTTRIKLRTNGNVSSGGPSTSAASVALSVVKKRRLY